MEATEVKITMPPRGGWPEGDRLRAFAAVVFDDVFIVRDIRILDGGRGLFIAMPQRIVTDRCPACAHKTPLSDAFCGRCGGRLPEGRKPTGPRAKADIHRDICHPLDSETREAITEAVIRAYRAEVRRPAPVVAAHAVSY